MENLYEMEKQGDITIINLVIKAVLVDDNEPLKKAFAELVAAGSKNIAVDLSKTDYVSSLVLASFVFMLKSVKDAGGNLVFCCLNNKIKELFAMTNLDKIFDVTATREEAIGRLSKK